MMELPTLGHLVDVSVTDAFKREAYVLTPWLLENLDRISEVIGISLVGADREVPVEGFKADLLAYDCDSNRKVLIENQLRVSDHGHLGQIMTYLAGLEASVIVWIAPDFREPHLAAIRWLNEHTVEPFAFFAIKLRVVRIGESNLAPLFEVVERPNDWERTVQRAVISNESEMAAFYNEYWSAFSAYLREHGAGYVRSTPPNGSWYEVPIGRTGVYIAMRISRRDGWIGAELYIGNRDPKRTFKALKQQQDAVHEDAGTKFEWLIQYEKVSSKIQVEPKQANVEDRSDWPAQFAWLKKATDALYRGLAERATTAGIDESSTP